MRLRFTSSGVLKGLCRIIALLLILSVAGNIIRVNFDPSQFKHINFLIKLFDVDLENNIPSFYSACTLFVSSLLLYLISINHKRQGSKYLHWIGLSLIFLFLAIDEFAEIHERVMEIVRGKFQTSGFLYYAWVIPYTAAAVIIFFIYSRFLMQLPKKTRKLILLSGAIFFTGAVGIEMLSAKVGELRGEENALYYLIISFEELFEMFGIALFIYTLLSYINEKFDSLALSIDAE